VKDWLEYLIPDTINNHNNKFQLSNLYIAATPINILKYGRSIEFLTNFNDKNDVINACMASVHIPLFMNKRLYSKYKNKRYIDGSFWSYIYRNNPEKLLKYEINNNYFNIENNNINEVMMNSSITSKDTFVVDYQKDEEFMKTVQDISFLNLITPDSLYMMMNAGYNFMKKQQYE
jgi:protoporphyrinogen oxidase